LGAAALRLVFGTDNCINAISAPKNGSSTLTLYGRYGLGQGALKFEASDANKVLIVNPCIIDISEDQLETYLIK